jgi:tetratricopeptide (TPR) repeat protein
MMLRPKPGAPTSLLRRLSEFVVLALALAMPIQAFSQTTADVGAERKRALELYKQNKFVEAIPLLEKVVVVLPSDVVVLESLGWAMFVVTGSTKDPEARKQLRLRALGFLQRAKDLGDDSELLRAGLEGLSKPDTPAPVSPVGSADAALQEGEAAHARGDLDDAIKSYKRALELDPKLYIAALFIGDMYFKKGYQATDPVEKKQMMSVAGDWFTRAITIDENVETAYRYWGDALMAIGDKEGARAKFVDAIIAEPWNRKPYMGLTQWANKYKVSMSHPQIEQPKSVTSTGEGTEASPVYYWSFYDRTRSSYKTAGFPKDHPGEQEYRHSLKEEASALRAVAELVSQDLQSGKIKTADPSLERLVKLFKADLIEAYVFFTRLDEGIVRDYAAYKKSNRDKLRLNWNDVVIAKERTF